MKKYKVNRAYPVNTNTSKNGIKWEYGGKKTLEDAMKLQEAFENNIEQTLQYRQAGYCVQVGLRITDTETNAVIYEKTI